MALLWKKIGLLFLCFHSFLLAHDSQDWAQNNPEIEGKRHETQNEKVQQQQDDNTNGVIYGLFEKLLKFIHWPSFYNLDFSEADMTFLKNLEKQLKKQASALFEHVGVLNWSAKTLDLKALKNYTRSHLALFLKSERKDIIRFLEDFLSNEDTSDALNDYIKRNKTAKNREEKKEILLDTLYYAAYYVKMKSILAERLCPKGVLYHVVSEFTPFHEVFHSSSNLPTDENPKILKIKIDGNEYYVRITPVHDSLTHHMALPEFLKQKLREQKEDFQQATKGKGGIFFMSDLDIEKKDKFFKFISAELNNDFSIHKAYVFKFSSKPSVSEDVDNLRKSGDSLEAEMQHLSDEKKNLLK